MTPFSFEWQWNIDYFIFMGFLYLALVAAGCGLAIVYIRTWLNVDKEEKGEAEEPTEIPSRSKYSEY
ncbi:MAG: hypothetical protein PVG99_16105 [Desulfobacteraceae bacterium]|jgi:hypothetical protein